ncbi:MAG: EAL domain-containing protein [Gammaproteobacteria bacterium]|nr:EAL domain-containing protein [Gammaproteobacteria bacterium]MCP4088544.1 EAL domain-containing protein [Gammaproteobacteria bacterium]MCP4832425.1 EAL domain-containing protein [Gammaproteobacteria bacterium]MCP4929866.1 EAL domain-containing protein [Gammaproteobacteria bacterium]
MGPGFIIFAIFMLFLIGACGYFWRTRIRYRNHLTQLNTEIEEVAANSSFGRRIELLKGVSELNKLAGHINQLFEALHTKDMQARKRENLFRDLADTMPEVILVHGEQIMFANHEAGELLGKPPETLVGCDVTDVIHPAYRSRASSVIEEQLAGGQQAVRYELQLIDADRHARWVEATGNRMRYHGRSVILTVARDITYKKSVEATLGQGRRQAQITLESLGEGVITADISANIDYMNAAAEKLIGTNRDEVMGKAFSEVVKLVDEGDRRDLGDPVSRSLVKRQRVSMGRRALLMSMDGSNEVSIDVAVSPIVGPNDIVTGAVIIMRDVGELRGLTREMSYQASHDALTGLVNRREFERQVNRALDQVKTEDGYHVLCYMDLDRFKVVNDTCGHLAGDNMLREVATLLREHVRDSDIVARLGGDEFSLLLTGCPLAKARQIADDVCAAIRGYRFSWQDHIFDVGISIGLVEIGQQSGALEDVLSAADSACYIAKQQGRGRVHVYSAMDEATARQRGEIHWLRKLQSALREQYFELYTQPIISVAGRVPSGPAVEVLLRINEPEDGLVLPQEFIPAAERYQLIGELDRWVFQATLDAVASGAIRLPDERSVAINISGQTMAEADYLDFVIECLDRSQLNPAQICFEVTESAVLGDIDYARRFVGVLHGMGCAFSLDDFGSDVGSLAGLKGLDIDFLKLDGVYTHNLTTDSISQEVVSAVIRLSKAVGFKVIAEQVEDQASFDGLRDLGVNFIQGNYVEVPQGLGNRLN